jgi:hypothetical protein
MRRRIRGCAVPPRRNLCTVTPRRAAAVWRLPRHLLELEDGRYLCRKSGRVVNPSTGEALELQSCASLAALVRGHAVRLLVVCGYLSLATTCFAAQWVDDTWHMPFIVKELDELGARIQLLEGAAQVAAVGDDAAAAIPTPSSCLNVALRQEREESRRDFRRLHHIRGGAINWSFGLGWAVAAGLLICRPQVLGVRQLAGVWVCAGLPVALCGTTFACRAKQIPLDGAHFALLLPPPPFTHFVDRS